MGELSRAIFSETREVYSQNQNANLGVRWRHGAEPGVTVPPLMISFHIGLTMDSLAYIPIGPVPRPVRWPSQLEGATCFSSSTNVYSSTKTRANNSRWHSKLNSSTIELDPLCHLLIQLNMRFCLGAESVPFQARGTPPRHLTLSMARTRPGTQSGH